MKRDSKKDMAYRQIKQMFLERRFEPESLLSENRIASALGISRTPVREALQVLRSEGFIDIFPKKGVLFRGVSAATAREIMDLRAAIEGYAAMNCLPVQEENLARLEEMLQVQRRCHEVGDVVSYLRHDVLFHNYFIELYGNSLILDITRSINERFMSVGLAILKNIDAVKISYEGHRRILDAVKDRDASEVVRAVYAHTQFGKSQFCQETEADPPARYVPPLGKR
ncbi:MAG: GntR family transcriptional regulator [Synergistaceae bacterium]|nr:GntR family transcriptional regulator [Synergistaceae bacterium]